MVFPKGAYYILYKVVEESVDKDTVEMGLHPNLLLTPSLHQFYRSYTNILSPTLVCE
jgi:hypothetical protein